MSVTLNPSAADPRICAATQDEAVWRQLLASVHESHEPYSSSKLSDEPMALVWTNDRLDAVPTANLPHRDPSIVGYMEAHRYSLFVLEAHRHSLFVYRSDLDVDNWAAWLTDAIVEIDIAESLPVSDQIHDSEILAIRQSILEEAGL